MTDAKVLEIDEKNVVVEVSADDDGRLTYSRRRLYTAYCRTEARQLYQGRNYQRALRVAEDHVDDNPRHVVTVIGS